MKFETVVTIAGEIEKVPGTYYISPADEAGEPAEGRIGRYAQIQFATETLKGCSESDLIGIVMHRLAARAQDGEHRNLERALQCLDASMKHLNERIEVVEVPSIGDLVQAAIA